MFCTKCGANIPDNAAVCPRCGAKTGNAQTASANTVPPQPTAPLSEDEIIAKRIRDHAKTCSILWIVCGALQVLTCVGVIAGVWNIIIGARELKANGNIQVGNRSVYDTYDNSLTSRIIGAVINFVFGLLVGCALSAYEFYIRDQVIKHRRVFGA